jgi:hypothetical protein
MNPPELRFSTLWARMVDGNKEITITADNIASLKNFMAQK